MEYSFPLNVFLIVMNFISLFVGIIYPILYDRKNYRSSKLNYMNSSFTSFEQENLLTPLFNFEINDNCNFPKEPIYFGIYDGIKKGCDCLNSLYYKKILPIQCSINHYKNNCKDIKLISSINLNIYEGKKFCVRKDKNYLNYLKDSTFNSCKINYKQCGIINNLNQKLCIPQNEECPLNYFKIDKNKEIKEEFEIITKPLSNGKYIHYSNKNINSSIIVLFNVNENSKLCLNLKQSSNINYYYALELNQTCYQQDKNLKFIASVNKLSFYKNNNSYHLIKNIPNNQFNKIKNENISLYSRSFQLNSIEINKYTEFFLKANYILAGITLILLIIVISGASFNSNSCKCNFNDFRMDTGNSGDNILSVICLAIISLILIVICGLICYCFSNFSYLILFANGKLHTIYRLNITLLILDILSFFFNTFIFFFEFGKNSIDLIALIISVVIPLSFCIFIILCIIKLYKLEEFNQNNNLENNSNYIISSNDNNSNFMGNDNNNNNYPINNGIYVYTPPTIEKTNETTTTNYN